MSQTPFDPEFPRLRSSSFFQRRRPRPLARLALPTGNYLRCVRSGGLFGFKATGPAQEGLARPISNTDTEKRQTAAAFQLGPCGTYRI